MGSITYKFSSQALTDVKSTPKGPGGRKYHQSLGAQSIYEKSTSATQGLQTVDSDSEEQLYANMIADGGQFCVLDSYSTVDENGFLVDLSAIFSIYTDETEIANVLEFLSSQQMVILNEIMVYNYGGFDDGNTEITVFSSGYNGLSSPNITVSEDTFFGLYDYYVYSVTLNSNESAGLKSRFGYPAGSSTEQQIESAITTAAAEVVNSYQSKRTIFKRVKSARIEPSDFGDIDPVAFGTATTTATTTDTDTDGTITTSTSRSY
tara:strand:- start:7927 stop:8715 length:789 start_codon:yes stop_codon:yes gene_type:complete